MRRAMMAGNWKMNKTVQEAVTLAQEIREATTSYTNVDQVVCPTFVCLPSVCDALAESQVAVGAQNVHEAASGAYTGEISATMLQGLVSYVIIGHSERRQYFAETDASVNQKVHAALAHDLTPIVCIGESLEQNETGQTHAVVSSQVQAALAGLDGAQVKTLVLAYEPIWAIGTGKAATDEQANQVCRDSVRNVLATLYGEEVAQATQVLYGGSTKESNIAGIMAQSDIDGALIGGAALKAESYSAMVRITSELYR